MRVALREQEHAGHGEHHDGAKGEIDATLRADLSEHRDDAGRRNQRDEKPTAQKRQRTGAPPRRDHAHDE